MLVMKILEISHGLKNVAVFYLHLPGKNKEKSQKVIFIMVYITHTTFRLYCYHSAYDI